MVLVGKSTKRGSGVTIVDMLLIVFFAFFTLFVGQAWDNPLAPYFITFAFVAIPIYLIAWISGRLTILKITKPTWFLGAVLSIPFWLLISKVQSSTAADQEFTGANALVRLFGQNFFNNSTQSFIVPLYETIYLIGVVVMFILLFRNPKIDKAPTVALGLRKEKSFVVTALMFFVSGIGALFHYVIAFLLSDQQQVGFNLFLAHQFLSFYVFVLFTIVLGLSAGISSHMVKNLIVYGNVPTIIVFFAMFLLLDLISKYATSSKGGSGISRSPATPV